MGHLIAFDENVGCPSQVLIRDAIGTIAKGHGLSFRGEPPRLL
jgi:hypothetical protein